ncbi:winged-helix domain-containing protein [Streptomyces sp. NPDC057694]|uniref:winged helix-turn-helix transcriptional regulator n=1 Tax=Streptomyces sp. NPDC057694 TaxID=3346216 RepID=UPI0036BA975D
MTSQGRPSTERALPLLLVAAPADVHRLVRAELNDTRYTFHLVTTGTEALRDLYRYRPNVLLLSARVRDPDLWEVLGRVREMTEDLFVAVYDRTYREGVARRALAAGADDYATPDVPLPLARALLGARLRRARPADPGAQLVDDGCVRLDTVTHEASVAGNYLPLTPLEFQVLLVLARNPGQVFSAAQLLERAWRDPAGSDPANVRYVVLRLRRSFRAAGFEAPIETVRGVGYRYRRVR